MPTQFSPEIKAQALAYLQNGLTIQEAADKTGVSTQTISNWKKANGGGGDREGKSVRKRTRKPKQQKTVEEPEQRVWDGDGARSTREQRSAQDGQ
jgi:transposase-like protein